MNERRTSSLQFEFQQVIGEVKPLGYGTRTYLESVRKNYHAQLGQQNTRESRSPVNYSPLFFSRFTSLVSSLRSRLPRFW